MASVLGLPEEYERFRAWFVDRAVEANHDGRLNYDSILAVLTPTITNSSPTSRTSSERLPRSGNLVILGFWVPWNPSLVLYRLLRISKRVRQREVAGRFDCSTTTEMVTEAVGADEDHRLETLDLSYAARFRQQSSAK